MGEGGVQIWMWSCLKIIFWLKQLGDNNIVSSKAWQLAELIFIAVMKNTLLKKN